MESTSDAKESGEKANGTSCQGERACSPKDRDSRPESLFESRGNLDTLAAAALKPLGDGASYSRRSHTPPSYQQTHSRECSPRVEQNESRRMHGRHDDHSSRYHYREHGQQLTDEDSEDGPSSHNQNRSSQQRERRSPPSFRSSQSPRGSYEQDQSAKVNIAQSNFCQEKAESCIVIISLAFFTTHCTMPFSPWKQLVG